MIGKLATRLILEEANMHTKNKPPAAALRPEYRHPKLTKELSSAVAKRSIVINGHKTSVSLEAEFWTALKEIVALSPPLDRGERRPTLAEYVGKIDAERTTGNLSSTLRLHVLEHYRSKV